MPGTGTTGRERLIVPLVGFLMVAVVLLAVPTGQVWWHGLVTVAWRVASGTTRTAAGTPSTGARTPVPQRPVAANPPAATPTPQVPAPAVPVPAAPVTTRDAVVPDVGALFSADGTGDHFCTASVVDSPQRNLLITAAHCLHDGQGGDYRTELAFVPGYHDGLRPYGTWIVTTERVDPRWVASSDQDADFGFATVAPLGGRDIEDVVGGNRLVTNEAPATVDLFGYPSAREQPLGCAGPVRIQSATQYRIDCPGYASGTSGGPWLANYSGLTHTGDVVGVIGGYEQGGYTDDISYTASFNDSVRMLYDRDD